MSRSIYSTRSAFKPKKNEDEELSKRWQNLENYVATKKSKKLRKLAKKIATTLKNRDIEPGHINEEEEGKEESLNSEDEGQDNEDTVSLQNS